MTKYITVKLTDDQANWLTFVINERLNLLNQDADYNNRDKQLAFGKRIRAVLAKAKRSYDS